MTFKVERKPLVARSRSNGEFREFVMTLRALKPGESFIVPETLGLASNFRMAISIVQMVLGVAFTTRAEGAKIRVARTQ